MSPHPIEVMKQALEALERAVSTCFDRRVHEDVMSRPEHFINQTITALRTAIEAAEKQEPVAWANINKHGDITHTNNKRMPWSKTPLYTTPPAAQRLEAVNSQLLEALIEMMDYSGLIEERCDCVATNKARAAIAAARGQA
jgi:hypothetical protein